MGTHKLAGDGQPQAATVHPRLVASPKTVEEVGERLWRNTGSVIRYGDLDSVRQWNCSHGHLATMGCVPERVGDQVGHHLPDAVRVDVDLGQIRGQIQRQSLPLASGLDIKAGDDAVQQCTEVRGLALKLELPRFG
jgi:hypothetical protein